MQEEEKKENYKKRMKVLQGGEDKLSGMSYWDTRSIPKVLFSYPHRVLLYFKHFINKHHYISTYQLRGRLGNKNISSLIITKC